MQCYSPFFVKNKYTNLKGENLVTPVPCGKCKPCKDRRARAWVFRLGEEAKQSSSVSFLTLTYDDENLPISKNGYATLVKRDFQLFMKNLRHESPNRKLKYYACGEYGSEQNTTRPHYHAVLFNVPHSVINNTLLVHKLWKKGIVQLEYPQNSAKTINYVTGYITKSTFEPTGIKDDRIPEFSLMSKGMGLSWLTPAMKKYYKQREIFCIVKPNGELLSMPRYYRERIFTKEELNKMYQEYINMQDENIEQQINDIGRDYFKRQNDEINALIRKTNKHNLLKRQKL